jgi:Endodeoxyribonuclease RusA
MRQPPREAALSNRLPGDAGTWRRRDRGTRLAKAYLDALQGIAYNDDRQVSHLTVRRFAMDHPIVAAADLEPTQRRARASVFVEVMPVAKYTELYDRAFKRAIVTRRRAGSPWGPTWGVKDHSELWKLRWRHEGKLPGGTRF